MQGPFFITVFKSDDQYFINATQEEVPAVSISMTQAEEIRRWERMYGSAHGSGFERSMSAAIHYMFFNPRVIEISGMDELLEIVEHEDGKVAPIKLSHVSGFATAFAANSETIKDYYNSGAQPRLAG